jgi:poly-gamma-glutamate synthesis protein (capsule biosynthesis protein)
MRSTKVFDGSIMTPQKSSNRSSGYCTILAAGDTSPPETNPRSVFSAVRSFLKEGDIRFCQAERVFSRRGRYHPPGLARHSRRDPKCAEAYRWAGFDVVSTAGNHSGDWGFEGVVDTVRTMERLGIRSIGSGRNIGLARKPAIFEKRGVKVGFLAYASVILPQYWATEDQPGVAPLRVNTYYEPYEFQPGCPARIITIPVEEDVKAMQKDIIELRSKVDCLVVSHHWGVHGVPKPLAQYQPTVARAAVDAGADVVLGHHTHCLQGVEIMNHNGRDAVVFYSLGNFAMPTNPHGKHLCAPMGIHTYKDAFYRELEPGHKPEIFTRFWLEGGVARIEAGKNGLESAVFLPTQARSLESGQPKPLLARDPAFRKVVTHMKWASEGLRGAPPFKVHGNEIEIYRR